MKILYTQPIFIPNEYMLSRNLRSVESINNILSNNSSDIEMDIKIGGWAINNELWEKFENTVNNLNYRNIEIFRYNENYGKAYAINNLSKNIEEYDFMLSADSDIVYQDIPIIDRLISMSRKVSNHSGKDFGMFALNQLEGNCHLVDHLDKSFEFGDEKVVWSDYPGSIAGGCIFTSSDNWIKCKGYREMGVYAGDDAYFLIDTHKNKNTYGMIESVSVIHPFENDEEYGKWKVKVCQRDTDGNERGISDDQIKEAMDFWKHNNKK